MKHKFLKVLFVIATVLAIGLLAVACNPDNPSTSEPVKYAVTYVGGAGSTGTAPSGGEYAQGTEITLPAAGELAKADHTFGGWSYGGQTYNAGAKFTMPANAVEFSAVWTPEQGGGEEQPTPTTYSVTYDINGATGTVPTETAKAQGAKFSLAASTGLVMENHTFGGWSYGGQTYEAGAEFTMPAKGVTFTAVWNENQPTAYTLSFATSAEQASGTAPQSVQKYAGDEIELPANTWFAALLPNYEFKGWFVEGNYSVTYQPGDSFIMPASNVTFMAKWGAIEHSVTYKAGNHATGADKVYKGNKGSNISLKSLSELGNPFVIDEDYILSGWKLQGDASDKIYEVGENYELNGDVVFVAQWEVLSYFACCDETGEIAMFYMELNNNTGYIMLFEGGDIPFTYTLSGTQLTVTLTDGGARFTGTFENEALTALSVTYNNKTYVFPYVEPAPPTVSFDANGGTGNAPAGITPTEFGDSYKFTTPVNTYTAPENCEFKAWMLVVNGTEKGEYKENVNAYANAGDIVVLKAIWQSTVETPIEGIMFLGNCTTPIVNAMFSQGGETYIKFVIDFDNNTVEYYFSDETHASATLLDSDLGAVKPDEYGADSLYFKATMGKKGNGKVDYYILVAADKSKIYLCDNNDQLLTNGEFTLSNGDEEESDFVVTALAEVAGKNFTTSDGSAFYSTYTTVAISWNANASKYVIKFTPAGFAGHSYNIEASARNQAYAAKNFTAERTATSTFAEFGFEKDGDNYILVITKIYKSDAPETNLISEEVRLTVAA